MASKKHFAFSYLRDLATRVYSFYDTEDQQHYWHLRFTDPKNPRAQKNLLKTLDRTQKTVLKHYGITIHKLEILTLMSIQNNIKVHPSNHYTDGSWLFGLRVFSKLTAGTRLGIYDIDFDDMISVAETQWAITSSANIHMAIKYANLEFNLGAILLEAVRHIGHEDIDKILMQMLFAVRDPEPHSGSLYNILIIKDGLSRSQRLPFNLCKHKFPLLNWDNLNNSTCGNVLLPGQTVTLAYQDDVQTNKLSLTIERLT